MPPFVLRLIAVASTAVVAAVALTGGGGEQHVALAIRKAERPNGTVLLSVECATDISYDQRPDPEGSGLEQVTVWGDPAMGTCEPEVGLNDLGQDRFVDGATSQVVTVSPSCLPKPETCRE